MGGFTAIGIYFSQFFLIASIWMISFLVACIILDCVKTAWSARNPITVIKEDF